MLGCVSQSDLSLHFLPGIFHCRKNQAFSTDWLALFLWSAVVKSRSCGRGVFERTRPQTGSARSTVSVCLSCFSAWRDGPQISIIISRLNKVIKSQHIDMATPHPCHGSLRVKMLLPLALSVFREGLFFYCLKGSPLAVIHTHTHKHTNKHIGLHMAVFQSALPSVYWTSFYAPSEG